MNTGISYSVLKFVRSINSKGGLLNYSDETAYLIEDCFKATYGSSEEIDYSLSPYTSSTMNVNIHGESLSTDEKEIVLSTDGDSISLFDLDDEECIFKIKLVAGKLVSDIIVKSEDDKIEITRQFNLENGEASLTKKVNGEFVINGQMKPWAFKHAGVEHFTVYENGKEFRDTSLRQEDLGIECIMNALDMYSGYKPEPLLRNNITL